MGQRHKLILSLLAVKQSTLWFSNHNFKYNTFEHFWLGSFKKKPIWSTLRKTILRVLFSSQVHCTENLGPGQVDSIAPGPGKEQAVRNCT